MQAVNCHFVPRKERAERALADSPAGYWYFLDHKSRSPAWVFCSHSDPDCFDLLAEQHFNQPQRLHGGFSNKFLKIVGHVHLVIVLD
jgi:hypothetical protein